MPPQPPQTLEEAVDDDDPTPPWLRNAQKMLQKADIPQETPSSQTQTLHRFAGTKQTIDQKTRDAAAAQAKSWAEKEIQACLLRDEKWRQKRHELAQKSCTWNSEIPANKPANHSNGLTQPQSKRQITDHSPHSELQTCSQIESRVDPGEGKIAGIEKIRPPEREGTRSLLDVLFGTW